MLLLLWSPISVQNCGREFHVHSGLKGRLLLPKVLSALDANNVCLIGSRMNIGLATKTSTNGVLLSFYDRDDHVQVKDPFDQSLNIFLVSDTRVFAQHQFDGSFYLLKDK